MIYFDSGMNASVYRTGKRQLTKVPDDPAYGLEDLGTIITLVANRWSDFRIAPILEITPTRLRMHKVRGVPLYRFRHHIGDDCYNNATEHEAELDQRMDVCALSICVDWPNCLKLAAMRLNRAMQDFWIPNNLKHHDLHDGNIIFDPGRCTLTVIDHEGFHID
jgi:hypothetical protein